MWQWPDLLVVRLFQSQLAEYEIKFYNEADFSARWLLIYLAYLVAFLMKHAKKMVLVDPRVLEQLKDKELFEHEKPIGQETL